MNPAPKSGSRSLTEVIRESSSTPDITAAPAPCSDEEI